MRPVDPESAATLRRQLLEAGNAATHVWDLTRALQLAMQQTLANIERGIHDGYNPDVAACAALIDELEERAFRTGEGLPSGPMPSEEG